MEFSRIIAYIDENPLSAGLADWPSIIMDQWRLAGETACPTERGSALGMAGNVEIPAAAFQPAPRFHMRMIGSETPLTSATSIRSITS
jgi:hypothetical protein